MILLEVGKLLIQAFDLQLEVGPSHGQVIQDSPQAIDVTLHTLVQEQFVLIPSKIT